MTTDIDNSITDPEYWDKKLEEGENGIVNIDKIEGFTTGTRNSISSITDLNLKEKLTDDEFLLYHNKDIIGAINYSREAENFHINFLATSNGDINKIVSDDEFKQYYEKYFLDKNIKYINGIGKELLKKFLLKIEKNKQINLVSLDESKEFYIKILKEFEYDGLIYFLNNGLNFEIIKL